MNRIPAWVFVLAAVVFAALAIWSATDANWSGVIVSIVLGALAIAALLRTRRTSA
jgi:hypothetical protein